MVSTASWRCRLVKIVPLAGFSEVLSVRIVGDSSANAAKEIYHRTRYERDPANGLRGRVLSV